MVCAPTCYLQYMYYLFQLYLPYLTIYKVLLWLIARACTDHRRPLHGLALSPADNAWVALHPKLPHLYALISLSWWPFFSRNGVYTLEVGMRGGTQYLYETRVYSAFRTIMWFWNCIMMHKETVRSATTYLHHYFSFKWPFLIHSAYVNDGVEKGCIQRDLGTLNWMICTILVFLGSSFFHYIHFTIQYSSSGVICPFRDSGVLFPRSFSLDPPWEVGDFCRGF